MIRILMVVVPGMCIAWWKSNPSGNNCRSWYLGRPGDLSICTSLVHQLVLTNEHVVWTLKHLHMPECLRLLVHGFRLGFIGYFDPFNLAGCISRLTISSHIIF